jgi:hypothetical protein
MKSLFLIAIFSSMCFLLCGFQQETSSSQRKPEPQVGSANKQKTNDAKATPGAPPGQPATDAADKNTTNAAGPRQNDKVDVTSLPPEIAVKQVKDSIDHIVLGCTIVLTIVGVVGTWVAVKTLRAIKKQAEIMDEHRVSLEQLTRAAQDNAAAAKASADALMNSERAFVSFPLLINQILKIVDERGIHKGYLVYLPVENNGNTITVEMTMHTNWHSCDEPLPHDFAYPDLGDPRPVPIVCHPKPKFPLARWGSPRMSLKLCNKDKNICISMAGLTTGTRSGTLSIEPNSVMN